MRKLLLALFVPVSGWAQTQNTVSIDSYMQAQFNFRQFNGAVLVAKKGTIIYEKAFGEADREWRIPNTNTTRFRIGSNTKQFTASCILKLAEEGTLTLGDKLSKYFPGYPMGDSVTIHMLLSHTSGITNYTDLDEFWDKPAFLRLSPDSLIELFKNKPFDFTPGTKCSYSNSGYFLLGRIIEIASGEKYATYLEKHLLGPEGLLNTRMDRHDTILPFRAKGYYARKNTFYNAGYIALEGVWSAGGLYSTTGDLFQWTKALHDNTFLSPASVTGMVTIHGTTKDNEKFGYGLMIDSIGSHPRFWHDGSIPGFTSYVAYYPRDESYIIVLSNNSFNTGNIGRGLSHVLFGLPIELPYLHREIKLDENILQRFVGTYKGTTTFDIILKQGTLFRKSPSGNEVALKPESETKLFYDDNSDRQLVFVFNSQNKVIKAVGIASGISTEIIKIE